MQLLLFWSVFVSLTNAVAQAAAPNQNLIKILTQKLAISLTINFLMPIGGEDTFRRKIKRFKLASLQSRVCLCFIHTMSVLTTTPPFLLIVLSKSLTNLQGNLITGNVLDQVFNT